MNEVWYCAVCGIQKTGCKYKVYIQARPLDACSSCWERYAHCSRCGDLLPEASGGLCGDCIVAENVWAYEEGILEFGGEDTE